ncbi:MAG: MFS transporter [Vampirovibrio sp.]
MQAVLDALKKTPARLYSIIAVEAISSFGSFFTFIASMALYIELTGDVSTWFWVPLVKAVIPLLVSPLTLKILKHQKACISTGWILALNILAISILASFPTLHVFFGVIAFMAWLETLSQPFFRQWASEQVPEEDLLNYNITGETLRWVLFTIALGCSGLVTAHFKAFACYWVDVGATTLAFALWWWVHKKLSTPRFTSNALMEGVQGKTLKTGVFAVFQNARWDLLFGTPLVTTLCFTYWAMNTISAFQGGLALPFVQENGWKPEVTHASYMYAMLALGGLIAFTLQQDKKIKQALNTASLTLLTIMIALDATGAAGKVLAMSNFPVVLGIQAIFGAVIMFLNAMLNTRLQRQAGPEHTGEVFGILVTVQKSLRIFGYAGAGLMLKFVPWGGHWGFLLSSALEFGVVLSILIAQRIQKRDTSTKTKDPA